MRCLRPRGHVETFGCLIMHMRQHQQRRVIAQCFCQRAPLHYAQLCARNRSNCTFGNVQVRREIASLTNDYIAFRVEPERSNDQFVQIH